MKYYTDGSSALSSESDNSRPADFFKVIPGGKDATSQSASKSDAKNERKANLSSAVAREASASKKPLRVIDGDKDQVKNSETPFISNVTGKKPKSKASPKAFLRKKFGPIMIITMILSGGAGLISLSHAFLPFAWLANAMDQLNSLRTSMSTRSDYLTRFAMTKGWNTNRAITKAGIFSPEKFKISSKMQKKLAARGITYLDDADGKGLRLLVYTDPKTKQNFAIAANDNDASKIPDELKLPDGKKIKIDTEGKLNLDGAIKASKNFDTDLNLSTRKMKGHIAGWFDSISEKFHGRIQNSRNRQRTTKAESSEEEIAENAKRTGLGVNESSPDTETLDVIEYEERDKDGNLDWGTKNVGDSTIDSGRTLPKNTMDEDTIKRTLNDQTSRTTASLMEKSKFDADVKATARSKLKLKGWQTEVDAFKKSFEGSIDFPCMVLKTLGAIHLTVTALQVAQIINYTTGFLEAVHKTQIGEGTVEMNYYMDRLARPGDTKDSTNKVVKTGTSSLESPATHAFFAGKPIDYLSDSPDAKLAKKYNLDYVAENSIKSAINIPGMSNLMSAVGHGQSAIAAFQACNGMRIAGAVASVAFDLVLAATTGGFGNLIKDFVSNVAMSFTMAVVQNIISSTFMPMILNHVSSFLSKDLITNMAGEDAAYAISSGLSMYQGRQFQSSSGMPGNKAKVLAFYDRQQEIIASEAEFERRTRSPFDLTSKHTFFGSIVNTLTPLSTTFATPLRTISGVAHTVGSSALSLLPKVNAASQKTWYELALNEKCTSLSAVGIVGDAYCNPYFVSDFSTVAEDPLTIYEKVGAENFEDTPDSEGNPKIKADSDFGKWAISCPLRESPFGYIDERIGSALKVTGNDQIDDIVNQGLSIVPIVGDILDAKEAATSNSNLDWTTGKNCLDHNKAKYFSRYSEDQRAMESLGIIEKSSVTAFIEEHYDKILPQDNSFEGVIARFSGLSKEHVEDTIALMEYANFVAHYDPTSKGPVPSSPSSQTLFFESTSFISDLTPAIILPRHIVYTDLRTRTLVA